MMPFSPLHSFLHPRYEVGDVAMGGYKKPSKLIIIHPVYPAQPTLQDLPSDVAIRTVTDENCQQVKRLSRKQEKLITQAVVVVRVDDFVDVSITDWIQRDTLSSVIDDLAMA